MACYLCIEWFYHLYIAICSIKLYFWIGVSDDERGGSIVTTFIFSIIFLKIKVMKNQVAGAALA